MHTRQKPHIFISYRRRDNTDLALALHRLLQEHLGTGSVFLDTVSQDPGERWPDRLQQELAACSTLIALIDTHWRAGGPGETRLENETDVLRRELETALADPELHVVPILLNGVPVPHSPPDVVDRLMANYALSVPRADDLLDPDGVFFQRLTINIWQGLLRRSGPHARLLISGTRDLAEADLEALVAHLKGDGAADVRVLSRFVSGAALLDVRAARDASRRWPNVIMLEKDLTTPLGRLRQQAVKEHPRLSLAVLSAGMFASGAAAGQVPPEAAGWTQRIIEIVQARPRISAIAAFGAAGSVAAGVALAQPGVGVSFEHAGFQTTVTEGLVQPMPLEGEYEDDPDPEIDHAILKMETTNPGLNLNGVRFAGVRLSDIYTLLLPDGTEVVPDDYVWHDSTDSVLGGTYDLDFPVPPGTSLRGARLQARLLGPYEPTVVGLSEGEVQTRTADVDFPQPTYDGPFWRTTATITLSNAWASREAGVDRNGEVMAGLDYGLRTRAYEDSVFIHFTLDFSSESDGVRAPSLGSLVVLIDGERYLADGSNPTNLTEVSVTDGVVRYTGTAEVPLDAERIDLGFRDFLDQVWNDNVEVTLPVDPAFLAEFDDAEL